MRAQTISCKASGQLTVVSNCDAVVEKLNSFLAPEHAITCLVQRLTFETSDDVCELAVVELADAMNDYSD